MLEMFNKQILVIGLDDRGLAARGFLRELDYLISQIDSFQPEITEALRPSDAVLANRASGSLERYGEQISAAWSLFTPCAVAGSLLEAVADAAKNATSGDVILRAPALSSWDQFQNHQHCGEVFCRAVKSIGRGVRGGTPNIRGETKTVQQ